MNDFKSQSQAERRAALSAAAQGFAGVAAGAFGSHALKGVLTPGDLEIWKTGVLYQLIHAVALLASASLQRSARYPGWVVRASRCWNAGAWIFSASLYALCLTGLRALGMITPLGGVLMLFGWASLLPAFYRPRLSP